MADTTPREQVVTETEAERLSQALFDQPGALKLAQIDAALADPSVPEERKKELRADKAARESGGLFVSELSNGSWVGVLVGENNGVVEPPAAIFATDGPVASLFCDLWLYHSFGEAKAAFYKWAPEIADAPLGYHKHYPEGKDEPDTDQSG